MSYIESSLAKVGDVSQDLVGGLGPDKEVRDSVARAEISQGSRVYQ